MKRKNTQLSLCVLCWHLLIFPGSCPPSIFSASELNFRVRNGNGWTLTAINTNYVSCHKALYIKQYALFNTKYEKTLVTRTRFELVLPA